MEVFFFFSKNEYMAIIQSKSITSSSNISIMANVNAKIYFKLVHISNKCRILFYKAIKLSKKPLLTALAECFLKEN